MFEATAERLKRRTRSPQAEQRSRSNTVRVLKGEAFWSTAADFGVRHPSVVVALTDRGATRLLAC